MWIIPNNGFLENRVVRCNFVVRLMRRLIGMLVGWNIDQKEANWFDYAWP